MIPVYIGSLSALESDRVAGHRLGFSSFTGSSRRGNIVLWDRRRLAGFTISSTLLADGRPDDSIGLFMLAATRVSG
jgi:hypothetical protein